MRILLLLAVIGGLITAFEIITTDIVPFLVSIESGEYCPLPGNICKEIE